MTTVKCAIYGEDTWQVSSSTRGPTQNGSPEKEVKTNMESNNDKELVIDDYDLFDKDFEEFIRRGKETYGLE